MQLVKVSVLAILVAACGAVQKPPDPSRRLEVHVDGGMFEIDRGYRFAAVTEPGADVVRLDVRYPVGYADDPPGKEGLAHLVEHLLFEVELARGDRRTSIGAELGRIALWSNAETHADYTTYEVMASPRALPEVLELEADQIAVGCTGLTPAIVAREREIVINEMRERGGVSAEEMQRQIHAAVFPAGHPYRRVATIESVQKLELADVCAFLQTSYQRGKAFVIASGAVTQASLQEGALKFARLRPRDLAARPLPAVVHPGPGVVHLAVDIEEPTLVITLPLPPMSSPEYRLLALGWHAIGPHLAGRAFEFGWGHTSQTWILGGAYAPVLAISLTLNDKRSLDEAIGAADQAMQYAARELSRPGDDRETLNWREHVQHGAESVLGEWESLDGRNALVGDFLQFDPSDALLIGRISELGHFEPKAAHDAAETWLSANRARYLLLEPTGTTTRGRKTYLGGGSPAHGPVVDGATADQPLAMPDVSLAIKAERYTLDNGLHVVLWPNGVSPLVHARLVVDSGSAHDPANAEGVAWLVSGNNDLYLDSIVESDRRLSTRIDDLIFDTSLELRKPSISFTDKEQKFLQGRLARARARERAAYDLALRTALYGARHPYARPSLSDASLEHISTDVVTGWARDHVVPKNATLILAGKFDAAIAKRHVAYDLDQVSSGSDSPDRDDVARTTPGFVAGVTTKPTPTVELSLAFAAGSGLDGDYARRIVLEYVLDAQLAKLRTTDAVTYGFSADYAPRRGGGLWTIGGDADATRASEAAAGLVTIVDDMRRDPEHYRAAFVLGRQKALEALLVGATSSAAIADRLALLARFDAPDHFFDGVARDIARMTLADFHRFVVRELAVDGQVVGAFGNDDAVATALAAAKQALTAR